MFLTPEPFYITENKFDKFGCRRSIISLNIYFTSRNFIKQLLYNEQKTGTN